MKIDQAKFGPKNCYSRIVRFSIMSKKCKEMIVYSNTIPFSNLD